MFTKTIAAKTFFSFLVCITTSCLRAQEAEDPIGNFTAEDIRLKECSFDKDADAVIIHDLANSNYNDEHNLITVRRIKFKILKEKGIERANIQIPFYSARDFEYINKINAVVLSVDGQKQTRSELSQRNIYTKKLNRLYSEVSFALPDVKVGSIIEYTYTSTMQSYSGLSDWYFQKEMPVMLSAYKLYIIPNAEFTYSVYKSPRFAVDINTGNGSIFFSMKNVPGLREEVYMDAPRDYLQRVNFQLSGFTNHIGKQKFTTTWAQLAQELTTEKMFGGQINKSIPDLALAKTLWQMAPSPLEKMKLIHEYVRSNITWNHIYSKYAETNLKDVWEKKRGNTGEINLLLLNLLKDANLEVYPMLVSERYNGKVDTTYPFLDQFNKVVALVLIDGNRYILDGSDLRTPSHLIPFNLLNTRGFIVDRKKHRFVTITDDRARNLNVVTINGTIEPGGLVTCQASVSNYAYGRISKKEQYNAGKSKYEEEFVKPYGDFKIDSFVVKGLDTDSLPLQHDLNLKYELKKSGEYFLLPFNVFTGFAKNPFTADHRFTNIDFGSKQTCILKEVYTLPANLQLESLPKKLRMITPGNSMVVVREVLVKDQQLEISMAIEINQTTYVPDEYEMVKEFYKKMFDVLNEPLVLKTK